MLQNLVLEGLA